MSPVWLVGVSALVQLWAAWVALRLARSTGARLAWACVSLAVLLMAARRGVTLLHALEGADAGTRIDVSAEVIALGISVLFVVGLLLMRPFFEARQIAEIARREAETRYREVVEKASDAILVAGPDGVLRQVNPRACEMTGHTREELVGMHIERLVPPDDAAGAATGPGPLRAGSPVVREWRVRRKDGSTLHVEASTRLLPDGTYQAIIHDVTARKTAEAALRVTTETLEAVIEAAPVSILVLDLEGHVLVWNRGAERIFGWTAAEVLGKPPPHIPESAKDDYERLRQRILGGETVSEEVLVRQRKDGEPVTVRVHAAALRDADGGIAGALAVQEDITASQSLAEQLRQAQKMEALGQLAGGVAHDFNNLLMAIRGHGELLAEALGAASPLQGKVDPILHAARRAGDLVSQLLAFSRRQVLQPRILDPNRIVGDTVPLLRRLIGEDIEIVGRCSEEVATVEVDPVQFQQVLINLAVNARDAMQGGGRLTIETGTAQFAPGEEAGFAAGHYVTLSVRDTGAGMDAETLAHVFDPFFTTKEQGKGTGLGLSTVYGIITQSGGHIHVDSAPGKGATFTLYFPASEQPADPPTRPRGDDRMVSGSGRILVVEDEDAVRSLVEEILRRAGYEVLAAATGEEALTLMAQQHPEVDLLVTDVVLPGIQGKALADRLVALCPGMKVVFTSGYTDDAVVVRGVEHSEMHFLQKPYSPSTLTRLVHDVLAGS